MTEPLHKRIADLLALSQPEPDASQVRRLLGEAQPIVEVHETGHRIADLFDPLAGMWLATAVRGCQLVRFERMPGNLAAMSPQDVADLQRLRELEAMLSSPTFRKAWAYMDNHLINEMAADEPEGRAALDAIESVVTGVWDKAPEAK